jgi:hypothetical protein
MTKPNKLTPGRNLLWESSRMMLPEHKEQLLERNRMQERAVMPELEEDQLQHIQYTLIEALEEQSPVTITYNDHGFPKTHTAHVYQLLAEQQTVKLSYDDQTFTLPFRAILRVDR